ncbi:unnamed protein product [Cochlearia groenlandica]
MAIRSNISYVFFLFTALLSIANPNSDPDLIGELVSLRSASDSAVIRLNDDGVSRFITSVATPRPYHVIIFFDAAHLHDNSKLSLKALRREFAIVSASFIANNDDGSDGNKLFFFYIDSIESESSFRRFAVESLPHIRHVDPYTANLTDKSGEMKPIDFERISESMAEFVEIRTNLTVGEIQKPPFMSKTQVGLIATIIVISSPILINKVIKGETILNDRRCWQYGAVFVYFFSVSGTMHNIINKVPLYIHDYYDDNNEEDTRKIVFFYEGSDFQLGTEGFVVGSLYIVVGLVLAFVTNVLVRVKNINEQRIGMVLALFVSFWAVKKVVYLNNWKTGYEISPYWPSFW